MRCLAETIMCHSGNGLNDTAYYHAIDPLVRAQGGTRHSPYRPAGAAQSGQAPMTVAGRHTGAPNHGQEGSAGQRQGAGRRRRALNASVVPVGVRVNRSAPQASVDHSGTPASR
jgi:hypothetical protein